jgi:hypothetical protein
VAGDPIVARNYDVWLSLRDCLTQAVERSFRTILESPVWSFRTVHWVLGKRNCADFEANLAECAAKAHDVRPKYGGSNKSIRHKTGVFAGASTVDPAKLSAEARSDLTRARVSRRAA